MSERISCPIALNARPSNAYPAIIGKEHTLSYQQLNSAINATAQVLNVASQERVALISANSVEYIIALFSLWRQGAIACLLSPRLPEEARQASLRGISCHRIIELTKSVTAANFERKLVPVTDFQYDLNNPADIMFTSGTSREPKAALHSLGNHYYNALAANEHIPFVPGDRWLLSLPLYHVGGLGIIWRAFIAGGTVVAASTDVAEALKQFNITHVSLVPTQLHRLVNAPQNIPVLQKMKAILLGGSAMPETLLRKAIDLNLPLYVSYGLTEAASQVATSERLTKANPLPRGQILKNVQVKISDKNEILVRGKTLFQGYLPTATPGVEMSSALDKEGWFHTGDLGCLNEDGTLTVLGRKDNMFISGGENIQPEEIEQHLCRIDGILQAVVVPIPNDEFGARPVAFIEIKEGMQLSKAEILSALRSNLPSFKLPDQIYAWPTETPDSGLKPSRSYFRELLQDTYSLKKI